MSTVAKLSVTELASDSMDPDGLKRGSSLLSAKGHVMDCSYTQPAVHIRYAAYVIFMQADRRLVKCAAGDTISEAM